MQIWRILLLNLQCSGWGFNYMILIKVNKSHTAKPLLKIYPLDRRLI